MCNDDFEIMNEDEYKKLTVNEKKIHINDLIARKRMVIGMLNNIIKTLAYKDNETILNISTQDDTKKRVKNFVDKKVQGIPITTSGKKYPYIMDTTSIQIEN